MSKRELDKIVPLLNDGAHIERRAIEAHVESAWKRLAASKDQGELTAAFEVGELLKWIQDRGARVASHPGGLTR